MMRRAPVLAVIAGLLVAVLMWLFLISPRQDERAQLDEESEALRAQQQQQLLTIARLEEIRDNELEMRAAIARLEQYVPDGASQPSTIRQLQLAADAAGVEIVSMTFADPQPAPNPPVTSETALVLAQIPITLVLEGGYFQGTDFLRRLESELPRAVQVDSLTMSEAQAPRRFPLLTITLSARIFAMVPPEAVGQVVETPSPAPGEPGAAASPAPQEATP